VFKAKNFRFITVFRQQRQRVRIEQYFHQLSRLAQSRFQIQAAVPGRPDLAGSNEELTMTGTEN